AAALFLSAGVSLAQENSCQTDFQRLSARRMAEIQHLNAIGKASKGKMNPMQACPVARTLSGVETEMMNYMVKNKEWCQIPDTVVEQFKAARAKSATFASQACAAAAQYKKMQEQGQAQAAAQAPKLPAGPL
ncbi:MAG TPA: hypothetical protein VED87_01075, partial [Methylocystis sp.]|nr:hypothetical protein [Methylocystis sp.]